MAGLTITWAALVALALATTLLAGQPGSLPVAGLLLLAWLKARLILGRFLHLASAPGWLAGFCLPLALWLALLGGLHALALR